MPHTVEMQFHYIRFRGLYISIPIHFVYWAFHAGFSGISVNITGEIRHHRSIRFTSCCSISIRNQDNVESLFHVFTALFQSNRQFSHRFDDRVDGIVKYIQFAYELIARLYNYSFLW